MIGVVASGAVEWLTCVDGLAAGAEHHPSAPHDPRVELAVPFGEVTRSMGHHEQRVRRTARAWDRDDGRTEAVYLEQLDPRFCVSEHGW